MLAELVFDTESDNLLEGATAIHCLNLIDRETGRRERYNDQPEVSSENRMGTLAEGVARLQAAADAGKRIAAHNGIKFDIELLRKFYPNFTAPVELVFDTLVASSLIWTNLFDMDQRAIKRRKRPKEFTEKRLIGRHSLEAWGYRLGNYKGDFKGPWDTFTKEMDDYCEQDCVVLEQLVSKIEEQGYSEISLALEHRVADIMARQERHGVHFDRAGAEKLEVELTAEVARLEDLLRSAFAPWFVPEKKGGRPIVMDPKRRRSAKVTSEDGHTWRAEYEPGHPYSKVQLVSFEPGSRDMIADRLIHHYGWVPTEFSEKTGKPTVDENTLGGLDYPEVKLLIRYLTVKKLLGTVSNGQKAWLKRVSLNSRIHSPVKSNGAVTGRMTHADHLAQVPKLKFDDEGRVLLGYEGKYGFEARSLFTATPGKDLVGVDAEGLELRILAHYMARYDGGAYIQAVVHGDKKLGTDVHTMNMKAVGLRTRDGAKTWKYAYLYGAGDLKLGTIFYEDMSEEWRAKFNRENGGAKREKALMRLGAEGRKRIETKVLGLGDLQKQVQLVAKTDKRFKSFDGRWLHIRSRHAALNTLLQGGGAIVMKKALVLAYDAMLAKGWEWGREFAFVLNVHDEFQMEADPDHSQEVGRIAAEAIRLAGEEFGLRCPLAGSSDIGFTWADTH